MRRVLTGVAPIRAPGGRKPVVVPARVGVLLWKGEARQLVTVIVKTAISFAGAEVEHVAPQPFSVPDSRVGEASRRIVDDFVPAKTKCDILIRGHVELEADRNGAAPLTCVFRAPGASLAFGVTSRTPGRVPLTGTHVTIAGMAVTDLGAQGMAADPSAEGFVFPPGYDYGAFQTAHPRLRSDHVPSGSTVEFEGLVAGAGAMSFVLPALAPRALVTWRTDPETADARLALDTMTIDLDALRVDLVYRGAAVSMGDPRRQIDGVFVGFASDEGFAQAPDEEPMNRFRPFLAELPRAVFSYAWERDDVLAGAAPPALPEEELEMARHEAFEHAAPACTLTLEEHAAVAAELIEIVPSGGTPDAKEREARAEVLRRHGFDAFGWSVEERAHAERLAEVPDDESNGVHVVYSKHFVAAQEALAKGDDGLDDAKTFAGLSVRLQVENPRVALADAKVSLGAYMRAERRWQKADATRAATLDAHLDAETAKQGAPRVPEVDDDGKVID